ncbi:4-hydroxy-tetrahydrodipicolinate reductase [Devosia insulae DS-56]|uniref:4-hydroxy-tetrahydrodipicolinate reductase n=1 Tax=Devosia insulae DS-56 TaxID=1116389 RepID=A0A1E5XW29_9HYPH|nr:4-hydroxy-tetrahydrodipicolinate reductase [Devosia insulae]OEO32803.1 4-hydroxy-tetrahydrodipicolinate reductase [Devosia insulae DS-56]
MSDLKVAIAGAGGKMGAANIRAIAATAGIRVVSAFDRAGAPALGKDAGELVGLEPLGVSITDDVAAALDAAEAILDFTAPANSVALAQEAAKRGLVHIIGTTGCSEADDAAIREAAAGARIVKAGNFSLGVNLLLGLVKQAAAALPGFDVEILEMHHNKKVDAPSGTALMLGEAAARGRNLDLKTHSVRVRDGHTGPREAGSIGFAALRGGNVIGEHKVILAGPSERIELNHIADNRALFADGAVRAALWVRDQRPGLYSMADVLGFN